MAYTTINKSTAHFNTKLYTGTGASSAKTGVGFQPDLVWIKQRSGTEQNAWFDIVRGATKYLSSNMTSAEATTATTLTSFDSDGFTEGGHGITGNNSSTYASWNWKAGGTAPAITYVVKVVSDSGNKYRFDDFGTSAVTLDLQEGGTYTFDQSDSSNSGHPLRFYTAADKTGGEYTTGVTTNGTPGSSGAYTRITVAASAPTLYYQCSNHAGMGGQANTNSTFGSSNFSGTIQSTVSANTTAGFSIVKYTGTGSATTVGHGLGAIPKMIIIKGITNTSAENWRVFHNSVSSGRLVLNDTDAVGNSTDFGANGSGGTITQNINYFNIGDNARVNGSGDEFIAYCFAEKTGYSKIGTYVGNGNADGTFVYTGFKPAFILSKHSGGGTAAGENWNIYDTARDTYNVAQRRLMPNSSNAESSGSNDYFDILSNGFKLRNVDGRANNSGATYIYMAFGQSLVGSNNIPCTAR